MRAKSLTPALACVAVVSATPAQAQAVVEPPPPSSQYTHTVGISSGVTLADRFDATASPRPFTGIGASGSLRYRFEPGAWSFTAEVNGSHASYDPRDDLNSGSEQAFSGGVALSVDKHAATFGKTSLRLGLDLDSRGEVLEHRYADVAATLSSFITAFATLGPTATVSRPLGHGQVSATAVVPVVGLAHQPYANLRQEREPVTVRAVGPSDLHGGSLAVRYETAANARMGVIAEYRLRTFDYSGGWRTSSLTNSTAIGIVTRFGAKSR
ncbi:MAG TPA: hypothetical protein VGM82_19230 [Gemmatimonadaceae bacterium]|jgi:hypothetical protein